MNRFANIALGVLILGLVAVASTVTVPRLLGLQPVNLTTGSMGPTYPYGTLLLVDPKVEPAVGSVITWTLPAREPVSHRVTAIRPDPSGNSVEFVTRGDRNTSDDAEAVARGYVVGVAVAAIPYAGAASALLGQLPIQAFLASLAVGLYVLSNRKPQNQSQAPLSVLAE